MVRHQPHISAVSDQVKRDFRQWDFRRCQRKVRMGSSALSAQITVPWRGTRGLVLAVTGSQRAPSIWRLIALRTVDRAFSLTVAPGSLHGCDNRLEILV